jgi:hypothetical protein
VTGNLATGSLVIGVDVGAILGVLKKRKYNPKAMPIEIIKKMKRMNNLFLDILNT